MYSKWIELSIEIHIADESTKCLCVLKFKMRNIFRRLQNKITYLLFFFTPGTYCLLFSNKMRISFSIQNAYRRSEWIIMEQSSFPLCTLLFSTILFKIFNFIQTNELGKKNKYFCPVFVIRVFWFVIQIPIVMSKPTH